MGLALIDKGLAGKEWIVGEFSLADPRSSTSPIGLPRRLQTDLPAHVQSHFERMMDRPAVRKALKDEGL